MIGRPIPPVETQRKTEERSGRGRALPRVAAALTSTVLLVLAAAFADDATEEAVLDDIPDVRVPAVTKVPVYPAVARRDRIEGEATVCFRIAPDGRILDPELESSTHEIFEKPALEAIRESSFEALAPGELLSATPVCRTYRFRLDPADPPEEV